MTAVFFHILIISAVFIAISRKLLRVEDKIVFLTFSLLKISCGILIGLLYWSYYGGTGDTIYFYEQSQALFQYFQAERITFSEWIGFSPLSLSHAEFSAQSEPRTFFFVRLLSFLNAFTQGNYFTMSIYLSSVSALATWAFANQLAKICREHKFVIYMALLFIPSITFWSSGLMKESLMTMAIYAFGYSVIKWQTNYKKWVYVFPVLISIFLLWKLKYYVPITLLPIVGLTLIFCRPIFLSKFKFLKKLAVYFALLVLGGLTMAFVHPVFHSGRFFELIRISHNVIASNSSEAIIQLQNAGSDFLFFIRNLPLAWFSGIFRPFIWEVFSTFSLLWAIEKGIFLLLAVAAFIFSFKLRFSKAEKWWGIAILIYSSILSIVITLATPNFGSLIRYEVAYMPFLWLLVLFLVNKYRQKLN